MNTLAKLIAAIAAMIASFAFVLIAKDGVTVRHKAIDIGVPKKVEIELSGSTYPISVKHEGPSTL